MILLFDYAKGLVFANDVTSSTQFVDDVIWTAKQMVCIADCAIMTKELI